MTATALYTFTVCIPNACSVEIIGSWDNFSTPYPLEKDRQRGHGYWVGCHSIGNIIYDGDASGPMKKRDGGLKQGGIYWYHYLVDGNVEYINPSESFSTTCPLLPGQLLNELEIATEVCTTNKVDRDYDTSRAFTLDPKDRYRKPRSSSRPRMPVPFKLFSSRNNTPTRLTATRLSKMLRSLSADAVPQIYSGRSTPKIQNTNQPSAPSQPARGSPQGSELDSLAPLTHDAWNERPPSRDESTPTLGGFGQYYRPDQAETAGSFGLSPPDGTLQLHQPRHSPLECLEKFAARPSEHMPIEPCRNTRRPTLIDPLGSNPISIPASLVDKNRASGYVADEEDNNTGTLPFETPPQLCSGFSNDPSPQSVFLPTPQPLRHETRILPRMKFHDPASNDEETETWRTRPLGYSQMIDDNATNHETLRLGSPFEMRLESAHSKLHPHEAQFENPFVTETRSLASQGFETHRQPSHDFMLQDLAYLGAAIV